MKIQTKSVNFCSLGLAEEMLCQYFILQLKIGGEDAIKSYFKDEDLGVNDD